MITEEEVPALTVEEELAGHRISIDLSTTPAPEVQKRIWEALTTGPSALRLRRSQGVIYQWRQGAWIQLDRGAVNRLVNARLFLWHSKPRADDYYYY